MFIYKSDGFIDFAPAAVRSDPRRRVGPEHHLAEGVRVGPAGLRYAGCLSRSES